MVERVWTFSSKCVQFLVKEKARSLTESENRRDGLGNMGKEEKLVK